MITHSILALYSSMLMTVSTSCPSHPDPYIDVLLNLEKPGLNLELSERQIAHLTRGIDSTESPYEGFDEEQYIGSGMYVTISSPGVTIFNTNLSYEISLTPLEDSSALQPCYKLGIAFTLDGPSDVYIANHLKRGSCEYLATLRHEEKHVILGRQILRQHKQIIYEEMKKAINDFITANNNKAFSHQTAKQMKNAFHIYIQEKSQQLMQELSAHMMTEQQKIDTHEEYARVRKECTFLNKYRSLERVTPKKDR